MLRTWRAAGLAVCVAALLPAPARPSEADDIKSELAAIRAALDELNKGLKVRVEYLEERAKTIGALESRFSANERDLNDLRGQVQILRDEVRRLRADIKGPEQPRVAKSFTPSTATGTVRVTNSAPFRATVFLNGAAYDVPPNRFLDIVDVPAGPFAYEVALDFYGLIRPRTERVLIPAQTYPININFR
jgi:hypothetical protein